MNSGALLENWAWMAGAVAVNVLWQGALVGGLGALNLAVLRKNSPQARYGIACATLFVTVLLLPLNLILLDQPLLHTASENPSSQELVSVRVHASDAIGQDFDYSSALLSESDSLVDVGSIDLPTAALATSPVDRRPQFGRVNWYDRALPWVGLSWWSGTLIFSCYNLLGLIALVKLRRRALPAGVNISTIADQVARRLGVRASVSVGLVDEISTAMVSGFFNVLILLPASMASGMAPGAVEAILAHEIAHIRRWDRWINLLQRLVEALLFFHPVVWWLSKRISIEREHCCDNVALQVCADRAVYVRALLSLASQGSPTAALSLSSHGGNFAGRVRAILSGHSVAQGSAQGRMAATLATLVVAVLPLALALATTTSSANSTPERVLRFPHNYSVGTLYGRWSDRSYRKVPWMPDHNEGWTVLGPAKGEVAIPENTNVKLTIGTTNLGFLRDLDPDALYYLDCRYKELRDEDIAPVATLTQLRALDLSDIGTLSGACLGKLGALEDLEWLDFSRTPISGYRSGSLAQFPNLKFFSGHLNDQADGILREAGSLSGIEFLCIKAATLTPDGLRHLNGKTTLRGLILDNVQLTDDTLGALGTNSNLLYLDLKKNAITDEAVATLNALPRLTHLDLENTAITDVGVEGLVGNPRLEQIFLSNTKVTEACLDSLASLPSLQTIKLVETEVSEERAGAFALGLASRPGNQITPQRSSNPDAPKVGLVMSHYTATGQHAISRPYGYSVQDSDDIARFLNEANLDVYAVVENGTETLGELPGILHKHGLSEKVLNGYDPDALATLDVVFISTLYNSKVQLLEALDIAIQRGVGLVNVGFLGGFWETDVTPALGRITGYENAIPAWQGHDPSRCTVLESHPILGTSKPGDVFQLKPLDGSRPQTGPPAGATILIGPPANYPENLPVLYVRDHGKGRVVRAQWHRPHQPGIPFPGFSFYVRCINWAAHRDADTIW